MTTNVGENQPPGEPEPEIPDLSTAPLQRLSSNQETQAQPETPNTTVVLESPEAIPVEEKDSTKFYKLDDDIEEMTKEFNDAYENKPKAQKAINCTRCSRQIAATEYHYCCWECDIPRPYPYICKECKQGNWTCDKHKNQKLSRREFKPYIHYPLFCSEIDETTGYNQSMQALKQKNTIKLKEYKHIRTLLNSKDELGRTPLHIAAEHGFVEDTKLLIESGALTEVRDTINRTALHTAITFNQIRIVQILLDSSANIEAVIGEKNWGERALHVAAQLNMWHILTLLLRKGAAVDALSTQGTALRDSVAVGGRRCVEILLNAGADVNASVGGYVHQSPPLHEACGFSDPETAYYLTTLLLDHGAEVSRINNYRRTPLTFAASQGHLDICKNLLERMGPGIEGRGDQLDRALYFAAENGHEDIVDLLIAAGAPLVPPPYVPSRLLTLTRKWKYMRFESKVEAAARERILSKLALAPSKLIWG
jgi:ankyrin repeat protein